MTTKDDIYNVITENSFIRKNLLNFQQVFNDGYNDDLQLTVEDFNKIVESTGQTIIPEFIIQLLSKTNPDVAVTRKLVLGVFDGIMKNLNVTDPNILNTILNNESPNQDQLNKNFTENNQQLDKNIESLNDESQKIIFQIIYNFLQLLFFQIRNTDAYGWNACLKKIVEWIFTNMSSYITVGTEFYILKLCCVGMTGCFQYHNKNILKICNGIYNTTETQEYCRCLDKNSDCENGNKLTNPYETDSNIRILCKDALQTGTENCISTNLKYQYNPLCKIANGECKNGPILICDPLYTYYSFQSWNYYGLLSNILSNWNDLFMPKKGTSKYLILFLVSIGIVAFITIVYFSIKQTFKKLDIFDEILKKPHKKKSIRVPIKMKNNNYTYIQYSKQ